MSGFEIMAMNVMGIVTFGSGGLFCEIGDNFSGSTTTEIC